MTPEPWWPLPHITGSYAQAVCSGALLETDFDIQPLLSESFVLVSVVLTF